MTHLETNSKRVSSNFHDALGKDGLSGLTKRTWDKAILKQVESLLRKDQKILDVGCGYGRIAIPLLKKGYEVYGIDLSRKYITELKRGLTSKRLSQRFKVADMCNLPFDNDTFDVVLCLWSSFEELLHKKEQVKAVCGMKRVLKQKGSAFIESHLYTNPSRVDRKIATPCGYQKRIMRCPVLNETYYYYNHDNESMRKILLRSGIKDFTVTQEWFGWRERMITRFTK